MKNYAYLVAGFVVGIVSARAVYKNRYLNTTSTEIQAAKDFYRAMYERKEDMDSVRIEAQEKTVTDAVTALKDYSGTMITEVEKTPELEAEANHEGHPKPYLLTAEEFLNSGEDGVDQATMTYYVGDNTLVLDDANNMVISPGTVDVTIGNENLEKFEDGQEIYVMCERLNTAFVVVQDKGSYSDEVAPNMG